MGNASLMAGDAASAIDRYDACIASTRRTPSLDAIRRDAEANRDYARRRLADREASAPESEPESSKPEESKPQPEPKASEPEKDEGPEGDAPRGRGGAGGSETDPRPTGGPTTPEERLDAALEHVREALKNRLPDRPIQGPSGDLRDW